MTWAQSAGRNFNFSQSSTPSRVSPCSYTINRQVEYPKQEKIKELYKSTQPRVTMPPPDLITPGPGSYDEYVPPLESSKNRPKSSFFLSRSIRDTYFKGEKCSIEFPSAADHGQLDTWAQKRAVSSTPHHPRKFKRSIEKEQTCNYLDDKGRMVYVADEKHSSEDIGPGSYNDDTLPITRKWQLYTNPRETGEKWVRKTDAPPPAKYEIEDRNETKLQIAIREQKNGMSLAKTDVIDKLSNPPKDNIPKRPNSVFLSRVQRDIFEAPKDQIPGPPDHSDMNYGRKKPRVCKGLAFGSRAVRFDKSDTHTPGPDKYKPSSPKRPNNPTNQFLSKTIKHPPLQATPEKVGPGSYNISGKIKTRPQQSPAFIDGSKRMLDGDLGSNPSPAEYTIKIERDVDATFVNMRYPKKGDWVYESMSDAPSPENYLVTRELGGPMYSFPKVNECKKKKKDPIGPGSYEINVSSVIHHSYNSAVPKYK